MSERRRAHIYRISLAVIGLLVIYGVVGEGEAAQWALLAAAALGLGDGALAAKHTSTKADG
jgi:hypothetical protein